MKEISKICCTCLSSDRRLILTSQILPILKEIKYEELQNTKSVCWECHSIIMKFYKFKQQVKNVQTALCKKFDQKSFSNLCHTTKQKYDLELTQNNDPLTNTETLEETEQKPIKEEFDQKEEFDEKEESQFFSDNDSDVILQVFVDNIKNKQRRLTKKKRSFKHVKKKIKEVDHTEVKEKFETVLLTEEEMLRSREEKRSHPNYKKILFKCESCVLGFTTKNNFDMHLKKKHCETIGDYICTVCAIRFHSPRSLKSHQDKHYLHYKCVLCEYKTSSYKAAINHCKDKHEKDVKGRIHCKQCADVVRTPEEMADHIKMKHTLHCNECGEKFKGKNTLRSHQVRIHAVKREFVCDVCTKTFLTKSRLESHMTKHSQTLALRLAYCSVCSIQYKDINVYRNHLRNHVNHAQSRYSCPECNKKFASKVYWTKHYNFYHLKKSQFKCETCNKLFISQWRLKNHRQKHHGLTRSRDHACNVCAKKFYTASTLRGHQLTHSSQRGYMCEGCGDTFKQRPALYTHARLVHKRGS